MTTLLRSLLLVAALLAAPASRAQPVDRATCGVAPGENMIVFVGRRIDVREVPPPDGETPFDQRFQARYRILQLFCGDYHAPEIEFEVYSHKGFPGFADDETVLLYVSRYRGRLIHQKYQYDAVYATRDGGWAGCGDPYRYLPPEQHGNVRPVPVDFATPPSFPVAGLSDDQIAQRFPPQFFERRGDRVICTAGASIEDLFRVKREGVLGARGLFGKREQGAP